MTPENAVPNTGDRTERVVRLEEQVGAVDQKVDKILLYLEGNGRPGLLVRVDRMEQIMEGQKWLARSVVASAIVIFVGVAWQVVTNFERIKGGVTTHESATGRP